LNWASLVNTIDFSSLIYFLETPRIGIGFDVIGSRGIRLPVPEFPVILKFFLAKLQTPTQHPTRTPCMMHADAFDVPWVGSWKGEGRRQKNSLIGEEFS
jgi:hypothetical protein